MKFLHRERHSDSPRPFGLSKHDTLQRQGVWQKQFQSLPRSSFRNTQNV